MGSITKDNLGKLCLFWRFENDLNLGYQARCLDEGKNEDRIGKSERRSRRFNLTLIDGDSLAKEDRSSFA